MNVFNTNGTVPLKMVKMVNFSSYILLQMIKKFKPGKKIRHEKYFSIKRTRDWQQYKGAHKNMNYRKQDCSVYKMYIYKICL